MVLLALSKSVRSSVSKKWNSAISGQELRSYSALSTLQDMESAEEFMGILTSAGSEDPPGKRKQGRPRKADTLATPHGAPVVTEAPPVKRKRGRPRKVDILAAQAAARGIEAPPVKRKRGRPRKAEIVAAPAAAGGGADARPVQRKRGRARKDDILAAPAADGSIVSAANVKGIGLVSDSDYDESLFTSSSVSESDSESNSSSDSDYEDDGQETPYLTHSSESNSSSDSEHDDDNQATPNRIQSSESNSSSDSDYDDRHSSDEDYSYFKGHSRIGKKKKKKKRRRRSGDIVKFKEPSTGLICHWCRQRSQRAHVQCSLCVIKFCPACLMNRNGEKIQEEMRTGVRWICPRCRGGCGPGCKNCCNCGPCRKSQGEPPTGALAWTAREAGFTNVHDYLINLKIGESAEVIARRKEGRGWTYATGAVGAVIEVSPIAPWGMKGVRTPKIPLGFLISKCREGREDAMACEMAETAQLAVFESELQDSCTIQERTGELCGGFSGLVHEEPLGGEDMSTLPDALDCQLSSTNFDVSEGPPGISMETQGTECWRTHCAIPKKKRSVRNRTARKEERNLKDVDDEKRTGVDTSLGREGEGKEQVGLPDLNSLCEEEQFQLPDLNSPIPTSDGVTNSYSSGQEITGVTTCGESERHFPLSAESAESSFSMRTEVTLANDTEAATSTEATLADETAAAIMVRGDDFRNKLDLILQRPFSPEQLKGMWDHFIFHRPSQPEEYVYHGSSNGEAGELLCDYFSDLYEKLARTFSPVEKLKLLRGFFFWLQHSSMEEAFQPWVSEESEVDQLGSCTPISISDSRVIDRLLAIDDSICKLLFFTHGRLCLPKDCHMCIFDSHSLSSCEAFYHACIEELSMKFILTAAACGLYSSGNLVLTPAGFWNHSHKFEIAISFQVAIQFRIVSQEWVHSDLQTVDVEEQQRM